MGAGECVGRRRAVRVPIRCLPCVRFPVARGCRSSCVRIVRACPCPSPSVCASCEQPPSFAPVSPVSPLVCVACSALTGLDLIFPDSPALPIPFSHKTTARLHAPLGTFTAPQPQSGYTTATVRARPATPSAYYDFRGDWQVLRPCAAAGTRGGCSRRARPSGKWRG